MNIRQSEANTQYGIEREKLLDNIASLRNALLESRDAKQARHPESWGHVGNLQQANADIQEIIRLVK